MFLFRGFLPDRLLFETPDSTLKMSILLAERRGRKSVQPASFSAEGLFVLNPAQHEWVMVGVGSGVVNNISEFERQVNNVTCIHPPLQLMFGLFVFEAGLQGQKVNVEDLIEDGRGTEQSTVQRPSHAVAEYVLTCTYKHTQKH